MSSTHAQRIVHPVSSIGRVPEGVRAAAFQSRLIQRDCAGNAVAFVMLDCSGTIMDRYVDAPAVVFVEVFRAANVAITMDEARVPMGLRKDLHIKAILDMPSVRERWREVYGREPDQSDVDRLFAQFVPRQLEVLRNPVYSRLLPGVAEVTRQLQSAGVKVGMTTGFTRAMLDILLAGAAHQGFVPDTSVAGDEVEAPRPLPYMVLKNLERLGVINVANAMRLTVKVDDTVSGAGEGAPLCWRVAVSKFSNYVVDSAEMADSLSPTELAVREEAAKHKLIHESGAHYVIDDLCDLPPVIADINRRLAAGENP